MNRLIGQTFGRLTIVSVTRIDKHWNYFGLCKCQCGTYKVTSIKSVVRGLTKSCGCLRRESMCLIGGRNKKHGLRNTRFYSLWHSMLQRCYRSKAQSYQYYGAKGIKVIKRWRNFNNFKTDMYDSYQGHSSIYSEKETSLDRLDNHKDYGPNNCQWVTRLEQQQSRQCVKEKNQ